jgi:hypothetical protein
MHKIDKKIEGLKTLHKILESLKPERVNIDGLNEIGKQVGYDIPLIVAALLQCERIISNRFLDVFNGYEVVTLSELESFYSQKDNEELFFRSFQIDSNYDTKPDFEFQLYCDPKSHDDEAELINNVRHLLPLFSCQGEYLAFNLTPDRLGELVSLSFDYSATVIAPNVYELIQDTIGGLEQGVYKIDEDNGVITPSNWYLRQQVRDGLLEMGEYGEIAYDDASEAYLSTELDEPRVFTTPLVVPISVAMVICIYLGYTSFHFSGGDLGIFEHFVGAAFTVSLLSQVGIVGTLMYNSKLLQNVFINSPVISQQSQIEELKPVVRTNMYSALFVFFMMATGALSAIVSIINDEWVYKIIVMSLGFVTMSVMARYTSVEERIKNLPAETPELERELNKVLQCWMHKPLPNF